MPSVFFEKWDIVWPDKYPESINCKSCHQDFLNPYIQNCPDCGHPNTVSALVAKHRPLLLWIPQINWYNSMSFGIPLSATGFYTDNCNQVINISDCVYLDITQEIPRRAMIAQATRIDIGTFFSFPKKGMVTDIVVQQTIEDKLFNWLFQN